MATVSGANNMMAGIQMSGTAESGFGVVMGGFHCPTMEVSQRLGALLQSLGSVPSDVIVHEENGYVTMLVVSCDSQFCTELPEVLVFRREPHKFFVDLPKFLASTRAQRISKLSLTGSLGSLCLTVLCHPAPRFNG